MTSFPFHHVVLAWDASADSAAALDLALRLIGPDAGVVEAVAVVDPASRSETVGSRERALSSTTAALEQAFEPFAQRALAANVRLRLVIAESADPAEALLDHAARHGSDLIVIGRRGSTGHLHPGLGPVARHLVVNGAVPVLVTGAP